MKKKNLEIVVLVEIVAIVIFCGKAKYLVTDINTCMTHISNNITRNQLLGYILTEAARTAFWLPFFDD